MFPTFCPWGPVELYAVFIDFSRPQNPGQKPGRISGQESGQKSKNLQDYRTEQCDFLCLLRMRMLVLIAQI